MAGAIGKDFLKNASQPGDKIYVSALVGFREMTDAEIMVLASQAGLDRTTDLGKLEKAMSTSPVKEFAGKIFAGVHSDGKDKPLQIIFAKSSNEAEEDLTSPQSPGQLYGMVLATVGSTNNPGEMDDVVHMETVRGNLVHTAQITLDPS